MDTFKRILSPYESESITVIVGTGDEARKFYIHKDFACNASPFFASCLATKHFPEGRNNTVLLPEDDPGAFIIVLEYVYSASANIPPPGYTAASTWFLAYILADKLCMKEACSAFLNHIMDFLSINPVFCTTVHQTLREFPECAATNYLIAQVAWDLIESGYDWICGCEDQKDGTACGWCQFVSNGGPIVIRILKAVANGFKDGETEPCDRGAEYWIDQARELQRKCGERAHIYEQEIKD